ncbi:MAG: vanadium-dependent haloperoxidase [Bacteroidetes bacterium]|nr:vanadium-dependent haloperoxidase [Bacteroidota bacterium]
MKTLKAIILCMALIQMPSLFAQDYLHRCNEKLIEVIMADIFSPPVASRLHAYPNIAAYSVLCYKDKSLTPMHGILKDLTEVPAPSTTIDYSLAACEAFCIVAKKLVYTESKFDAFENIEYTQWLAEHNQDSTLYKNSRQYAKMVGNHIIDWMLKDNYNYTRTLIRYQLTESPTAWRPTPPEYMNALEPNWPLMRSFVFDSSNVVRAIPDVPYSEKKNSTYYKNAMAVYNTAKNLQPEQKEIGVFWDDNANISKSTGHLSFFIHKATPGGHWIRIARKACKDNRFNESQTATVYTAVTISLYEGFISCWIEKYKSNAVRPETYINRLVDPKWMPLIESPPFPEYTSGHSVVSSAAAEVLTHLIPQPYAYIDSNEMEYGIAPRSFASFKAAAAEASISRFYGGIHYMPSLDNGAIQGAQVADFVLKKLKLKK